eukprot:6187982-Pleurochrysis_carterae.AAC.2
MPDDGVRHVTECMQLTGMRGGDKVRWQFKLMTGTAVDTLFVRGMNRKLNPMPKGTVSRQGPAFLRRDNGAVVTIIPPITFTFDASNPLPGCNAKMTVLADSLALPTDGVFRFDDSVEYDEDSQLAMRIFLATVMHRMPSAWQDLFSRAQRHQVDGLARHE